MQFRVLLQTACHMCACRSELKGGCCSSFIMQHACKSLKTWEASVNSATVFIIYGADSRVYIVWGVGLQKDIQLTYYFQTSPTYSVTPGILFTKNFYSLPSECCNTMDKIKWSNYRATTTQCILRVLSGVRLKNSNVYRPATPTQLLLHCAHSSAIAWVAPHDRCHYKAWQLFGLHAKEAIATKNEEAVPPNSWGCPFIKNEIFLL